MLQKIKSLIHDGFIHIVGASTINKVISLCSGIIIVRILSKQDYGIYSYVINIVSIILLMNGIGTITAILQYGCELREDNARQKAIIRFGGKTGLMFNSVLSIAIIAYGLFFPKSIENTSYLFVLSALIPISSYCIEFYLTVLRIKEENKKYSCFSVANSLLTLGLILLGAHVCSVTGAISFRYFSAILLLLFGFFFVNSIHGILSGKSQQIDSVTKKSFIKFSMFSCANNSIAHLFYNIDIFIIGVLVSDEEIIASYKVATTIPLALTFITSSIITYVYPKFVKNRYNYYWLKKHYLSLLGALTVINGFITIVCILLAPHIIRIVFGEQYVLESVGVFKILMIGFFVSSTFRMLAGNVLDMLHLIKPNFYISIFCCVVNIILDVVMIKKMSYIGAAIATSLTYLLYGICSNGIVTVHFIKMRRNQK